MPRLVIATAASAEPMGAEAYQEKVASRAAQALAASGAGVAWRVDRTVVRSLRSPLAGSRRLPMGWLSGASPRSRRAVGRLLYPSGAVVHRMSLELPPAPVDVITIHDVVAWKFHDEAAPVRAAAEEARRAAAVICVSAFSAAEAVDLLGISEPHVVPNGVDDRFLSAVPLAAEALDALGLAGRYVLTAGGASARKNLDALAQAWPLVRSAHPDVTLVLAGPEHPRRTALFAALDGVRLVGRVSSEVLPGLYAGASAVAVPSLHEGFGLPALEGMAAGAPVVVANRSALPEVVGDAGLIVEPDPASLAEGLVAALDGGPDIESVVERGRRRAREFTWDRTARGHAVVWRAVASAL